MEVVYTHCAGLDVHKKTVVACRTKPGEDGEKQREVQTFGTTTPELLRLLDWLQEWGCTQVAMESTGDYWKPIYNLLEGQMEVLLVNAYHVKHVPGRKSDVQDVEWLTDLLQHGLLRASFIPPAPQRDLRDLTRYRTNLVEERAREANRVQKLLEGANIKLGSVASNILGVSGRAMLEALIAGQQGPEEMAALAVGRLRSKQAELEKALTGLVRPHHRVLLAQQLAHIDFLESQIEKISQEIEHHLADLRSDPADPPEQEASGGSPTAPRAPLQATEAVALLDTIPGIDQRVAEIIVAELGLDMSRFPTAQHAASWAGLAPGHEESAGQRYSGRTRPGNPALRTAMIQAAWAAVHTKNTYLSAQYQRLVGRRGKKRAIVAVAHSLIVTIYCMLSRREPYREVGGNYFDERRKDSVVNRLLRRLQGLGYGVHLEAPGPAS